MKKIMRGLAGVLSLFFITFNANASEQPKSMPAKLLHRCQQGVTVPGTAWKLSLPASPAAALQRIQGNMTRTLVMGTVGLLSLTQFAEATKVGDSSHEVCECKEERWLSHSNASFPPQVICWKWQCDAEMDCWSGSNKVKVKRCQEDTCKEVPLKDVRVGDKIETFDGKTTQETIVLEITHRDPVIKTKYLRLEIEDGAFIEVSPKHYLLTKNTETGTEAFKFAMDVYRNTNAYHLNGPKGWSKIKKHSVVEAQGKYQFITDKDIVDINGITSSCYSEVHNIELAKKVYKLRRFLTRSRQDLSIEDDQVIDAGPWEKKALGFARSVRPSAFAKEEDYTLEGLHVEPTMAANPQADLAEASAAQKADAPEEEAPGTAQPEAEL